MRNHKLIRNKMKNIIEIESDKLLEPTLSKKEINSLITTVVSEVNEGYRNPLETVVKLKAISKVADGICSDIMEQATNEASKYSKNEKVYGAKIDVRESGVKYDYSRSQTWRDLVEEKQALEAQIKEVEAAMRVASEHNPYVDITTGEVFTTPAPKQSKTIVAVTF